MDLIAFGIVLPWLFVGVGCWLGFQLLRQNGRILLHLEELQQRLGQQARPPTPAPSAPAGLPVGSSAPEFELPDLNGQPHALAEFRGHKVLLIFFNPRCGFCSRMAPDLAKLTVDGANSKPIPLVVSTGDPEENRKLVAEHEIHCPVLLQDGMEVASRYQCHGTPMGYLIDEQGKIASEVAVGSQSLLGLMSGPAAPGPTYGNGYGALGGKRSVADSKINRNGLTAGTPAPPFRLPGVDGGELSLEEYRGRKVLLVFSDPKCGPCDQIMPQLELIHRSGGAVQVLMVSRGETEANRAKAAELGLTFPVVLQRQWEISREYGMFGTPAAYLIDEDGIIAADVAVGMEPILALLSSAEATRNGKAGARRHGKGVAPMRR
jgi:peroxiredoxin